MKLSVAMATYNGAKHIAEQLQSFADQERQPDQLVICDDQSSDETLAIVDEFQRRVPFEVISIRNEVRLGIIRNFSKAIEACSGDVIFLSDQDDVWAKEKLRRHEEIYLADAEQKIKLVFNNAALVGPDLEPLGRTTFHEFSISDNVLARLNSDHAFASLLGEQRITGCTLSFRAQIWKVLPEISSTMLHDQWLGIAAALLGELRVIPETLNLYRQHATQACGAMSAAGMSPVRTALFRQYWLEYRGIQDGAILDLIEKLHEKGVNFPYDKHRQYTIGSLSHLWRRISYPKSLLRRLPLVSIELLLGYYWRYNENLKTTLSLDIKPKFFRDQIA